MSNVLRSPLLDRPGAQPSLRRCSSVSLFIPVDLWGGRYGIGVLFVRRTDGDGRLLAGRASMVNKKHCADSHLRLWGLCGALGTPLFGFHIPSFGFCGGFLFSPPFAHLDLSVQLSFQIQE